MLYSPVTEALWAAGIVPHYCANITGHGWRKLLRHPASELTYRIHTRAAGARRCSSSSSSKRSHDDREAYSTLNMGAGFAIFVKPEDAERTVEIARAQGIAAWHAGTVEAGPKRLLIEPLGIEFGNDDLQLR